MTTQLRESTSSGPTLQERAAFAADRAAREAEEYARQRAESIRRSVVSTLVQQVSKYLGVAVSDDDVTYTVDQAPGFPSATVEIDDLTFGMYRYASYSDRESLSVAVPCERGCGYPVWSEITDYRLESLNRAITEPQRHLHDCLVRYDEDGEPTTDRNGNPLPPRRPLVPTLTPEQLARQSIASLENAAQRVAHALNTIARLEDSRALIKPEAIKRLMESGAASSATAAEKIVEKDDQYIAHRERQRDAEVEKWGALAAWEAAKLSAELEVALIATATNAMREV